MSHSSKFLADQGHAAALKMREEQAAQRDLENRVRAAHDPVFAAELGRMEAADPSIQRRREAQARRAARNERKAAGWKAREERADATITDANARRVAAMATPLSPAMHRAMVVLAVLCALSVVGLPITALIAYMLHAKGKAHTTQIDAQRTAAAAEAQRYLTDEDRDWMRRQGGQV